MSFRARTARILALLAVFVILFLWGWALFFPPSTKAPGTLQDRSFPEAADQICTTAAGELALLPKSYQTTDPVSRSEVVAKSDVILNRMLDNLTTIAPRPIPTMVRTSRNGLRTGDHLLVIANPTQKRFSSIRRRFYVSLKDKGQVTQPIDFFATFNKMYNCVTPDDIE